VEKTLGAGESWGVQAEDATEVAAGGVPMDVAARAGCLLVSDGTIARGVLWRYVCVWPFLAAAAGLFCAVIRVPGLSGQTGWGGLLGGRSGHKTIREDDGAGACWAIRSQYSLVVLFYL